MFCRQKIWAKDSNVHDGMASEVPCTDLFEIKAKNIKETKLFEDSEWRFGAICTEFQAKKNQHLLTWEGQPIVAPLECVDFWQSSRGDVTRRERHNVSFQSIKFPASHRGCPWHSTQRRVATRSLRHNTSNSLTTVKKHVLSWEGNCKVRRNKCSGNVWRPRSMHKWWEGWPGPHPETSLEKKLSFEHRKRYVRNKNEATIHRLCSRSEIHITYPIMLQYPLNTKTLKRHWKIRVQGCHTPVTLLLSIVWLQSLHSWFQRFQQVPRSPNNQFTPVSTFSLKILKKSPRLHISWRFEWFHIVKDSNLANLIHHDLLHRVLDAEG